MSHFVTEDQAAFRDAAQAFARKEIEPIAAQIDREERTPPELSRKLAEQGFFWPVHPGRIWRQRRGPDRDLHCP